MKKWLLLLLVFPLVVFAQTTATDLFFSEYIEGSSNNKALEIFNGTGQDVDLSNYVIFKNFNGNPWDYVFTFPANTILKNGDVYVIANSSADSAIQAVADTLVPGGPPNYFTGFNGDDARALAKIVGPDTIFIDVIGVDSVDPGSGWDVAGVPNGTQNHTLIRKPTVISGNTDWYASAGTDAASSEWIVNPQDDFSDLGKHTFNPNASLPPIIDNATATYQPFTPGMQTISVKVTDDGVVTEVLMHYFFVINDQFPTQPTDTMTATMSLVANDTFSVDVDLSNLSDGDGFVYWFTAMDDQAMGDTSNVFKVLVGTSPLSKVHALDANNAQLYNGFLMKATGIVTAGNGLLSSRYFFFQDATGGVKVYDSGSFGTMQIAAGDSIDIVGTIDEYKSEAEIVNYQSINVLKSGLSVNPAVITTASVGEAYEGMLVTIQNLDTVAGGSTAWGTNYFNLDMADDDGQIIVRIASDSLNGMPEPNWPADITGVLGMYNSAYQLLPRFVEDISTLPALGIDDDAQTISKFEVYQNYPNPFNPTTTISFNLPKVAKVRMVVFNALGQVVKSVEINGKAGMNKVQFDASQLTSGIYFYQINYDNKQITRKMLLVK